MDFFSLLDFPFSFLSDLDFLLFQIWAFLFYFRFGFYSLSVSTFSYLDFLLFYRLNLIIFFRFGFSFLSDFTFLLASDMDCLLFQIWIFCFFSDVFLQI